MKPALLVNRHAGGGRAERVLERSLARVRDVDVVAPSNRDELADVAKQLRDAGTPRIGVVGGDGTVHSLLTALDRAEGPRPMPTLALLGGGTLNTIAHSVGTKRLALRDSIDAFRSLGADDALVTTARETMRCNGALGSLFGVGVVETFLRSYYGTGAPTPTTAAKLLATAALESITGGPTFRSFTGRERLSVSLVEGEELHERPTLAVAAGTIADLGLGFRPFHRVTNRLGVMHVLRYHGDAASLARALPRVRFAKPLPSAIADDRTTRGFTVHGDSARLRYMFDGDLYEHEGSSLRVDLGPTIRYATLHAPIDGYARGPVSDRDLSPLGT